MKLRLAIMTLAAELLVLLAFEINIPAISAPLGGIGMAIALAGCMFLLADLVTSGIK